jgi:hypothetical protein
MPLHEKMGTSSAFQRQPRTFVVGPCPKFAAIFRAMMSKIAIATAAITMREQMKQSL